MRVKISLQGANGGENGTIFEGKQCEGAARASAIKYITVTVMPLTVPYVFEDKLKALFSSYKLVLIVNMPL